MLLTPIRAPGKRRRANEELAAVACTRPQKERKLKHKSIRQKSREQHASYLELMPLEVLERIFWMSGNANLPRAGHRIGRLLSGRSTLRETFINAFGDTWDSTWNEVGDRFEPLIYVAGNPEFQVRSNCPAQLHINTSSRFSYSSIS